MSMRLLIAVLLGGGLCVIAYFKHGTREPSAAPGVSAHPSPTSKPVRMVPFSGNTPHRVLNPIREVAADRVVTKPGEDAEITHAKPAPSAAEVRDGFDAFFHAETADPAWSQRMTDALMKGIQAVLPAGSRLQRLECRGTLCRIEISHTDLEEFHTYTRDAFSNLETRVTTGALFTTLLGDPTPGRPVVSVAFLAREGTELPSLETVLAIDDKTAR